MTQWPSVRYEGEATGDRWIPLTKDSDAEIWCFLWTALEQKVEQTIETLVIWSRHRAHYDLTVMITCICRRTYKYSQNV